MIFNLKWIIHTHIISSYEFIWHLLPLQVYVFVVKTNVSKTKIKILRIFYVSTNIINKNIELAVKYLTKLIAAIHVVTIIWGIEDYWNSQNWTAQNRELGRCICLSHRRKWGINNACNKENQQFFILQLSTIYEFTLIL